MLLWPPPSRAAHHRPPRSCWRASKTRALCSSAPMDSLQARSWGGAKQVPSCCQSRHGTWWGRRQRIGTVGHHRQSSTSPHCYCWLDAVLDVEGSSRRFDGRIVVWCRETDRDGGDEVGDMLQRWRRRGRGTCSNADHCTARLSCRPWRRGLVWLVELWATGTMTEWLGSLKGWGMSGWGWTPVTAVVGLAADASCKRDTFYGMFFEL